ncbi:MAG: hypothetical protein ACFFFT_15290 [Candidatus Thorarchaeota archaeon]
MMEKIKEQIIDRFIEYSRAIYSIISDMGVFYISWVENSIKSKDILEKKAIKLKFDIEESVVIKNQIIKEFSEAFSIGAEDWAILIQKMDSLANLASKFVSLLEYIDLSDLNTEMKDSYHNSIKKILEMVNLLKGAIKLLRDNPNKVIYNINEIHELGNSTDLILNDFLHYLYKDKYLKIRNLLVIRDNIKTLEQFVDKIYHIAEIIRVLRYE